MGNLGEHETVYERYGFGGIEDAEMALTNAAHTELVPGEEAEVLGAVESVLADLQYEAEILAGKLQRDRVTALQREQGQAA